MGTRGSRFKTGCFGCLGVLVLLAVFVAVNAVIVMNRAGDEKFGEQVLSSATAPDTDMGPDTVGGQATTKPAPGHGWVLLDLAQGDFQLHRGAPGSGVVVKAGYDANVYAVEEFSRTWPDSAWVYQLRAHRTISGLQAILAQIMGDAKRTTLHIFISPDVPVDLNLLVREGGLEGDLGGLWLTGLDLRYRKGGLDLDISEPLVAPLEGMTIHGRMGGADLGRLGNASPRNLVVSCAMGGMALDLRGAWTRDCDTSLDLRMGGMSVLLPDNMELADEDEPTLRRTDAELTRPTLHLHQKASMGEIEFQ